MLRQYHTELTVSPWALVSTKYIHTHETHDMIPGSYDTYIPHADRYMLPIINIFRHKAGVYPYTPRHSLNISTEWIDALSPAPHSLVQAGQNRTEQGISRSSDNAIQCRITASTKPRHPKLITQTRMGILPAKYGSRRPTHTRFAMYNHPADVRTVDITPGSIYLFMLNEDDQATGAPPGVCWDTRSWSTRLLSV